MSPGRLKIRGVKQVEEIFVTRMEKKYLKHVAKNMYRWKMLVCQRNREKTSDIVNDQREW